MSLFLKTRGYWTRLDQIDPLSRGRFNTSPGVAAGARFISRVYQEILKSLLAVDPYWPNIDNILSIFENNSSFIRFVKLFSNI